MKTRIVHTEIHYEDDWFNTLPIGYRYLFMYLFTNMHIGQTGAYKLTDRVALTETGADKDQWAGALQRFVDDKKIIRIDEWVIVRNAKKYSNYGGTKNQEAFRKEYEKLPQKVKDVMPYGIDTLSYSTDTTINNKSEIINHIPKTINTDGEIDIDEIDKGIQAQKIDGAN